MRAAAAAACCVDYFLSCISLLIFLFVILVTNFSFTYIYTDFKISDLYTRAHLFCCNSASEFNDKVTETTKLYYYI